MRSADYVFFRNARGSGDCLRCPRAARADWCDACKALAYPMEKIKRRLGLVISIDLARREIRYEREHAMRSVDNERKEQKYPETLNFDEKGSGFVLMAKEIRPGIETKFGERTAVECIERVSKKRVTVWWPKGIPVPSLQLPCMLVRLDKKTWKLVTCDTREEGLQLWKTGEISNPAPASADSEEFA